MRFEVALQVRPADLASLERQVAVGPPAIRRHDRRAVGEQLASAVLVTIASDPQDGVAFGEGAPERAPAARESPAGFVHVQVPSRAHTLKEVFVGVGERVAGALQDRLDAARADPSAEQLLAELDDIATRDPVAHRERRDRGLQPRPERALGDLGGQHPAALGVTGRAAHPLALVLDHDRRDHRQLLNLMTRRHAERDQVGFAEHVPTLARLGPVLDDLIHRRRWQQLTPATLVAGLAALLAWRATLSTQRRAGRRVLARRRRRVTRRATQPSLELRDPLLLPSDPLRQRLDLAIHPQQHLDHDLTALVIDRLRLRALHTPRFAAPALCPPNQLNAYALWAIWGSWVLRLEAGRWSRCGTRCCRSRCASCRRISRGWMGCWATRCCWRRSRGRGSSRRAIVVARRSR